MLAPSANLLTLGLALLTMKGQKTIDDKAYAVELVYGFEENKPSGAFTLTTNR
jgi:hypothetical protein